ncbi:MAG: cupin domain-containing protein [Desulfovibrio sp.]|jgi:transcriptional regulator with XRE-family HTH domain|nr:cupin domain-containing protein [Desulfovibrio sp.]
MSSISTVGARICSFREDRALSLESLAENTGLSVEFLKKVESGKIYPSIGPLQKIARALGVRLGTFMDDQYTCDPVISRIGGDEEDEALHKGRSAGAAYVYHALGKGKSDRNMEPFFIEIKPSGGCALEPLSHQGEEFILVLKGEIFVLYGRERHVLKEGDTIYYNSIVPHCVGTVGDNTAEILAVIYSA